MTDRFESNFQIGSPLSAYWQYVEGNFSNTCFTQGASFLRQLRAMVGLPPGAWDDALQAQLIGFVNSQGSGWQTVLTALQQDASVRVPGSLSLQTGIFLAYYRPNGRRFDSIQILPGTVPPAWDTPPADDRGYNGGRVVCYDPAVDTDPSVSQHLIQDTANSATGVRIEPGRPGPSSNVQVVQSGPQTVSPLTVALISVFIIGVGAIILRSSK